jgi:hypothetical protein
LPSVEKKQLAKKIAVGKEPVSCSELLHFFITIPPLTGLQPTTPASPLEAHVTKLRVNFLNSVKKRSDDQILLHPFNKVLAKIQVSEF